MLDVGFKLRIERSTFLARSSPLAWDVAALAQHYGLPTRLLDWSYDLYVSLYFATQKILYANPKSGKELLEENSKYIIEGFRKTRRKESEIEVADNIHDEPKIELVLTVYHDLVFCMSSLGYGHIGIEASVAQVVSKKERVIGIL